MKSVKKMKSVKDGTFFNNSNLPLIYKLISNKNLVNEIKVFLKYEDAIFYNKLYLKRFSKFFTYEIEKIRKQFFPSYSLKQLCFCGGAVC